MPTSRRKALKAAFNSARVIYKTLRQPEPELAPYKSCDLCGAVYNREKIVVIWEVHHAKRYGCGEPRTFIPDHLHRMSVEVGENPSIRFLEVCPICKGKCANPKTGEYKESELKKQRKK